MKVSYIKSFEEKKVDARALFLYKDYDESLIPEEVKSELELRKDRGAFEFTKSRIAKFTYEGSPFFICSIGTEKEKASLEDLRFTAYKFFLEVKKERYAEISVMMEPEGLSKLYAYSLIAEMASNSEYDFNWFKSKKKDNAFESINLVVDKPSKGLEEAVKEGLNKGEAVKLARRLVDEPANIMTPEELASVAKEVGKKHGIEVDVYEKDKIEKLGMTAYLNVARGASSHPKLIVMRYRGAGKKDKNYGIVGKGLCYDSGGYSLKPSDSMLTMKSDMAGAAAVIAAMQLIAVSELKVNVTCVVAACQNMIGPDAYLPGDIISSMLGKTIYIGNTDAEGRLTLADALTYIIQKEKVDTVFDYATLTGAAIMAFGSGCAATLTNDDAMHEDYIKAAELAGEKAWRLPIFREYEELIEHHEADLTNSAGKPGTITAGMFLREFVEDTPWIHVDIAPIAHLTKASGYYDKGATGYGVKSIYEFMKSKED